LGHGLDVRQSPAGNDLSRRHRSDLLPVTSFKSQINPITNPNPVSSHYHLAVLSLVIINIIYSDLHSRMQQNMRDISPVCLFRSLAMLLRNGESPYGAVVAKTNVSYVYNKWSRFCTIVSQ
jgi:hypothetical protein